MTLRECYESFGGNYDEVISRLVSDERIEKYLRKYTENNDFLPIKEAILASDRAEAFRNTHSLKGIALSLGLSPLFTVSDTLCEYLRSESADMTTESVKEMLSSVEEAYNMVTGIIEKYLRG